MSYSNRQTTTSPKRDDSLESDNSFGSNMNANNELEYESVLEKIGFGKTQWIQLLISGLLTMTSMGAQTSIGILVIAMQCEFQVSQSQKGIMMASCVTGVVLSTYIWGYVSDAVGRRNVLLVTTFVTNFLQFITMFVTNIWVFNIVNFFMGISLGGISAAIYAYLSEFNVSKYRAIIINYSTAFVSITAIYVPATAWLVLSSDWSLEIFDGFTFRAWRLIILLNLLPGLIGALMLLSYPESPKLLLAHNKENEAIDAVEWICKYNTGRSLATVLKIDGIRLKPEFLPENDVIDKGSGWSALISIWKATVPMFYKPHGINVIISVFAVFGMFFSSAGMQTWFPEIVNRYAAEKNVSSSTICEVLDLSFRTHINDTSSIETEVCDDTISSKTYIDNIVLGVAFLIGFLIQGTLLRPFGRKNVLIAALIIGALSGFLLHFVTSSAGILFFFCIYMLMPGLSISIMCGAVVDFLPTQLRGKAVSFCLTMGRIGVILATNIMGATLAPLCNTTFAIFTFAMLVCAALVHFLPV